MNREQKIERIRKGKFFAVGDLAVLAVCVLLTAAFTLLSFGFGKEEGERVEIFSFGKEIAVLPLDEDAEYLYTVRGGEGRLVRVMIDGYEGFTDGNLIRVQDGRVCVAAADCPDHTCMLMGNIAGGEILCMPHGLTVKVIGGLEGGA